MRYTGQCSHGMPLGRRCAKCDESPMADFTTVKVNTRELQAGVEELDALKSENAALRTRAESAERERDEALAALGRQYNSCEAYTEGQMDMKEAAEEAAIDTWSWDEAIEAIRNLPIKERP